ncbi:MAG: hypothetical protein IJM30_01885 [Thermoguttaceae bacterium]|nr:hypothetical protein [Thermoguttaceae bacterium]
MGTRFGACRFASIGSVERRGGRPNVKLDFIEGYEGEPYVSFEIIGADVGPLNVWEGLFDDLLDNPDMSGKGWRGFTRDYHELKGIWDDFSDETEIQIPEYLKDLENYKNASFRFEDTSETGSRCGSISRSPTSADFASSRESFIKSVGR